MPQGVLLDIDGTLLLSNDAHARAWVDALAEFGFSVPFDRLQPLIGMGSDTLLAEVAPGLSSDDGPGKEMSDRRGEIFMQRYASGLQPTPGARDLVLRFLHEGLQIAIASSSTADQLEHLLSAAGVQDLIETKTTSSDVQQSKPAPDVVQVALERLGLDPKQVLMLGDTPYDIQSGNAAGVDVVAVRTGGHTDDDLVGAKAIFNDPADIVARYEHSPFADLTLSQSKPH